MKNLLQNRKTGLMLLVLLLTLLPFATLTAKAVDVARVCSLTLNAGSAETIELLDGQEVRGQLYRVAEIDAAYRYKPLDGYAVLEAIEQPDAQDKTALNIRDFKEFSDEQQKTAAEAAAALAKESEPTAEFSFFDGVAEVTGLETGLYVLCVDTVNTGEYLFRYAPVLVSLPSMNAADGTDLYDIAGLTLKPEVERALGGVLIEKTLQSYSALQGTAIFVFQVEATLNGETVYSNVVSMAFTAPGQKQVLVDGLPVGAEVTVTEVYSGSCYTAVTEASRTVTVRPESEETVSAEFVNDYDKRRPGGTGITNRFEPGEEAWQWVQTADSTEG